MFKQGVLKLDLRQNTTFIELLCVN